MGHVAYDFTGEVVVITGAAGGIGKAVAKAFADAGANVVIGDLKMEQGEKTVEELSAGKGSVSFIMTDVTSQESVNGLVQSALDAYGKVDILVNGAGVCNRNFGNPFTDLPDEDFDFTFKVNEMGVVHMVRAVYDFFKKQQKGRIINVASTVGHSTNILNVPYCISKAAVLNLTVNLAKELGPSGITVNAICPGYIYTDMYENAAPLMSKKNPAFEGMGGRDIVKYMAKINCATQKEQYTEDIANAALFLASDEANSITGTALDVAGGYKI